MRCSKGTRINMSQHMDEKALPPENTPQVNREIRDPQCWVERLLSRSHMRGAKQPLQQCVKTGRLAVRLVTTSPIMEAQPREARLVHTLTIGNKLHKRTPFFQ